MQDVKWGVIGCGGIARTFAASLHALGNGTLLAGASRTPGRAAAFAAEWRTERSYTDYESLVADPDVDAVYVATTHNFHYENIKLCLQNGKHVLCEKPIAINVAQTKELMALSREKNLFLMEGMWTRFLPAIEKLQALLAEGVIGDVVTVKADFSITGSFGAEHRLKNRDLAGGALLDLGIYPIAFASLIFGEQPSRIQSSAVIGETGVDDRSFYFFDYPKGRRAILSSSFSHHAPPEGVLCGTTGCIRVPVFHAAKELHILREGQRPEILKLPYGPGENFKFEIAHVMKCIKAGKIESEIMPLSESLAVMETMDTLRAQWGLTYPGE